MVVCPTCTGWYWPAIECTQTSRLQVQTWSWSRNFIVCVVSPCLPLFPPQNIAQDHSFGNMVNKKSIFFSYYHSPFTLRLVWEEANDCFHIRRKPLLHQEGNIKYNFFCLLKKIFNKKIVFLLLSQRKVIEIDIIEVLNFFFKHTFFLWYHFCN